MKKFSSSRWLSLTARAALAVGVFVGRDDAGGGAVPGDAGAVARGGPSAAGAGGAAGEPGTAVML
jgi:hypothetical protein